MWYTHQTVVVRLFRVIREGQPELTVWATSEESAQQRVHSSGIEGPFSIIPGRWGPDFRLSGRSLQLFYRQMSTMVNSGMAIDKALEMTARGGDKESKVVIERITSRVRSGCRLSTAMAEFPGAFTAEQVGVIKLSERMGALHRSLSGLADLMERRMDFRGKLISALAYPTCLAIGIFTFGLFFMSVILPKDRDLLGQFGAEVPALSRAVMAVGDHWMVILFGVALVAFGVVDGLIHRPKLRAMVLARVPALGRLSVLVRTALQLRVLSLVVDRGGTIPQALDLMKETSRNQEVQQQLMNVKEELIQGSSLCHAMDTHQLFTPIFRSLVAVGYESGSLDKMAMKCAEMCEFDVETSLATLVSLIEPLLMGIAGLAVGVLILAGAMPLLSIVANL